MIYHPTRIDHPELWRLFQYDGRDYAALPGDLTILEVAEGSVRRVKGVDQFNLNVKGCIGAREVTHDPTIRRSLSQIISRLDSSL